MTDLRCVGFTEVKDDGLVSVSDPGATRWAIVRVGDGRAVGVVTSRRAAEYLAALLRASNGGPRPGRDVSLAVELLAFRETAPELGHIPLEQTEPVPWASPEARTWVLMHQETLFLAACLTEWAAAQEIGALVEVPNGDGHSLH